MGRGKQLNIYVPADKADAVERLRRLSKSIGTPINQLVIDAIAQYLNERKRPDVQFRSFDLKVKRPFRQQDLYEQQLDHKLEH